MFLKKLIGSRVSLATVSIEDAEKWVEWLNDLAIAIPLGDEAYKSITAEQMKKQVADSTFQSPVFSIIDNASDSPIGRCLLFNVNHIDRTAMLGIFIGEKQMQGKGYGKEAINLLLDYGFNLLNLNSIMLGVFSFNTKAIQCYRSAGFKEIGRRRQARLIGRQYYDCILMDILAEEFRGSLVQKFIE